MDILRGKYTTARITARDTDDGCLAQIQGLCDHPAFTNPIVIMPDAHAGKGAVIGFTMRLGTAVVPEVVGVDIGCGVLGARLAAPWDNPAGYDRLIRSSIPMGFDVGDDRLDLALFTPWLDGMNRALRGFAARLGLPFTETTPDHISALLDEMGERSWYGIGSLGGGNHFIEAGREEGGGDWLFIHSGSRNFGLKVCEKWQQRAAGTAPSGPELREIARAVRRQAEEGLFPREEIPERIRAASAPTVHTAGGVPWLEGEGALGYLREMLVAQVYACLNRRAMLETVLRVSGNRSLETVETVHNYISSDEPMTIRKGAVSAKRGERLLVPLNMAEGVLLCEGAGNEEWNLSAPHGAGRRMSRKKALRTLDSGRLERQMAEAGVYTGNRAAEVLDEAPDAYKPAGDIVALLPATATILGRVRPVHNIKAKEEPFRRRGEPD